MLIEATLLDLLKVTSDMPEDEKAQAAACYGSFDPENLSASLYMLPGIRFSFYQDGEPYAVGGYQPFSRGVSQSWMVCRNGLWDRHGKAMTKAARKVCDAVFAEPDIHRVQTICLASRVAAMKWYRTLALTQEGLQRKAGANGEDFAIFARVK